MKQINLNIQGMDLSYATARALADSIAGLMKREPVLMAWHDKPHGRMGPDIPGGDPHTRWHDYGENYGGTLDIRVNGDYDFIFAESDTFAGVEDGEQPYISARDSSGNEYLCLRDAKPESDQSCTQLEETTSGTVGH